MVESSNGVQSLFSGVVMAVFLNSGHYRLNCTMAHRNYQTVTLSAHIYLTRAYCVDVQQLTLIITGLVVDWVFLSFNFIFRSRRC